jgi:hypothetical protein
MEIETSYIRTIDGYKGQLHFNGNIVWESEEFYPTYDEAEAAAFMKLNSSIKSLFD